MKLVFASNNKTKKEFQQQLPATIEIVSLEDIGCYEEILETADTIEGICFKKLCNRKVWLTIVLRMTRT
jgi:inosine/xanthosine triphosphate pyrophosphatase family protein